MESSCDNFQHSSPGRIWVKWKEGILNFTPQRITSQLIHGFIRLNAQHTIAISVVYASNSYIERQTLWKDLLIIASDMRHPWTVIGDFNCCRLPSDKAGGTPLTNSSLGDFNNMIFNTGLHDLSSVGHFYTWFNQQQNNPIHIKLDRVLINDSWLNLFPNSFYKVGDPSCSDHSPLFLLNSEEAARGQRFMFKNYCTKFPDFWDCLLDTFSQPNESSPLCSFIYKLKTLKNKLKFKPWANFNNIQSEIDALSQTQHQVLSQLQIEPLNSNLNESLKEINYKLNYYHSTLSSWMAQRAKVRWLTHGEDDLKFLYSKINVTKNYGQIKEISNDLESFNTHQGISQAFIGHFAKLFNTSTQATQTQAIPVGNKIPPHLISSLTAPNHYGRNQRCYFLW
ncbi:hypothetical protein KFK09_016639 [Dendrobium nobile]|uniref:Endonuclease/exonuclease/phosphatase domain-containing protein n=1 Tax=Dendrobium nobile TaxID=94219 RepID=A0A8T3B055_DENNO|nr:hypothetical protein KFK09_016639 [Dendrobium nobile]